MQRPKLEGLDRSFSIVYELDVRGEHDLAAEVFLAMTAELQSQRVITADFALSANVLKRLMQHGYIFSIAFIFQAFNTIIRLGYESGMLLKNLFEFPVRELATYTWELLNGKAKASTFKITAGIGLILGTCAAIVMVALKVYTLLKKIDIDLASKWRTFVRMIQSSKVVSKARALKFWMELSSEEQEELLGSAVAISYQVRNEESV